MFGLNSVLKTDVCNPCVTDGTTRGRTLPRKENSTSGPGKQLYVKCVILKLWSLQRILICPAINKQSHINHSMTLN